MNFDSKYIFRPEECLVTLFSLCFSLWKLPPTAVTVVLMMDSILFESNLSGE